MFLWAGVDKMTEQASLTDCTHYYVICTRLSTWRTVSSLRPSWMCCWYLCGSFSLTSWFQGLLWSKRSICCWIRCMIRTAATGHQHDVGIPCLFVYEEVQAVPTSQLAYLSNNLLAPLLHTSLTEQPYRFVTRFHHMFVSWVNYTHFNFILHATFSAV